jgi:flagellin-like protein
MKKGISTLIATVLLLAFTVSIGIITFTSINIFTRNTTTNIENQTTKKIDCSFGAISMRNVCLNNTNLTGFIENTGSIELKDIKIKILYSNGSSLSYNYTQLGFEDNILFPGNKKYIDINVGNVDEILLISLTTNCPKVDDELDVRKIETC